MNIPMLREEEIMDELAGLRTDALDYAEASGLMNEEVTDDTGDDAGMLHDVYARAGFDAATSVDAAMNHTCQLTAGMSLLYPDEV